MAVPSSLPFTPTCKRLISMQSSRNPTQVHGMGASCCLGIPCNAAQVRSARERVLRHAVCGLLSYGGSPKGGLPAASKYESSQHAKAREDQHGGDNISANRICAVISDSAKQILQRVVPNLHGCAWVKNTTVNGWG